LDPVSKGSLQLRTGGILGIPHTFAYESEADIHKELFQLTSEYSLRGIDWDSDAGKVFLSSMLLSDKAKMFAIAREVKNLQLYEAYILAILRPAFCLAAVLGYNRMTPYFDQNPLIRNHTLARRAMRFWTFVVVCAASLMVYCAVTDRYQMWKDRRVDLNAARLSYEMADGGIEYYEKMILRNKAARELLGEKGKEIYSVYGNEIPSIIGNKTLTTQHLQTVKKAREELEKKPPKPVEFNPNQDPSPLSVFSYTLKEGKN
jgi:hypothetical protein